MVCVFRSKPATDSSPLVSKLRENNKMVIGIGVKSSTSDLLMNHCDEFIFYDDLVREVESSQQRKRKPSACKKAASKSDAAPTDKVKPEEEKIAEQEPHPQVP